MSILSSPKGTSCGRCGRKPALGHARVNDVWLCHPDEDDLPDCYSLWQRDQVSHEIARLAAENAERWKVTLTHLDEADAAERYRERMGRNRSREERLNDLLDNAVDAPTIEREGK